MKSIHIRDVDEATLARLKQRAVLHHRSLQGELHAILDEAVQRMPKQDRSDELDLIVVETNNSGNWSRDTVYGDDAR
jgi:plasmid stability protein